MKIPRITCHNPIENIPLWAILERQVFSVLSQAPKMLEKYLTPEGELFWPENVTDFQTFADANMDNVFEGFQSFPLLYLLGGDDFLLEYSQKEYDALIRQLSKKKKKT